jgi:hypothetical protein
MVVFDMALTMIYRYGLRTLLFRTAVIQPVKSVVAMVESMQLLIFVQYLSDERR